MCSVNHVNRLLSASDRDVLRREHRGESPALRTSPFCKHYVAVKKYFGSLFQESPLVSAIIAILLLSGAGHLGTLFLSGGAWEGSVSARKPGLFAISAGATLWSLLLLSRHMLHVRGVRGVRDAISVSLLLEVVLITLQFHRGVPSHFNHATPLDACIESAMLMLVLAATAGICWLAWQTGRLTGLSEHLAEAYRSGLWFLIGSCLIGAMITVIGEQQLEMGRSPEILGRSGVLKYPHGIVLHALQTLPAVAWMMSQTKLQHALTLIRIAVSGHALLLAHAVRQTLQGRARFDTDLVSMIWLISGTFCILLPVFASIATSMTLWFSDRAKDRILHS